MNYQSLSGDKLHIHTSPQGLGLYIVPAAPPFEAGIMDLFQFGLKHSTLARFRAALRDHGRFTTDDRKTQATLADGQLALAFQSQHTADQHWTTVFGVDVTAAILDAADGLLGAQRPRVQFAPPVSRNADCPCGSGRKYKRCCLAKDAAKAAAASGIPATTLTRRKVVDEIVAAVPLPHLRDYARAARENAAILEDPFYWNELGMELGRARYFAEARRAQEIGVALAPDDALLRCNLAVSINGMRDLEEALRELDAVPADVPKSAIIRANLLFQAKRLEDAVPYFERAIEEEPDFDLPYLNLIEALEQLGSPQAEVWLRRAVNRLPTSPDVAVALAMHLHGQDRLEELADAEWIDNLVSRAGDTRMIGERAQDPQRIVAAQLYRGCAQLMTGHEVVRIEDVVRLAVAHRELGGGCDPLLVLFALAVERGAAVALDRIHPLICDDCRADRLQAPLSVFRAESLLAAGEWALARDEAQRALEEAPEHFRALHVLWWSLDELGANADALKVAERFALVQPENEHIEYNMGLLAAGLGEHGRAAYHYTRQLARFPDHAFAQENLALTLLINDQFEQAVTQFADAQARRPDFLIEHTKIHVIGEDGAERAIDPEALDYPGRAALQAEVEAQVQDRESRFQSLLTFARGRAGSPTYVRDVIAFNATLSPSLGSPMLEPQAILTADAMLGALLETNEARRAEMVAKIQRHQRGDRSAFVAHLDRLINWDGLPVAARESLLEAESRFHDGMTRDHSPTVVSYAKSIEVTLQAVVFLPLRGSLNVSERRALASAAHNANDRETDKPLCRFFGDGRALALGDMLHALRRAADRPSSLGEDATTRLRRHVLREELGRVLDPQFIDSGLDLSRQRNSAAHASQFDLEACTSVRQTALAMLTRLTGTRPSAGNEIAVGPAIPAARDR